MQLILLSILASLIAQAPGAPALTEALAAAASAGQSPETAAPWTAPDQEAAAKTRPGGRPVRSRSDGRVPAVPPAAAPGCRPGRQGPGAQLFPAGQPDFPQKLEDRYEPVRFMHAKHASQIQDCALCHHYRPLDESASETVRCSACHQEPFNADHPERLGLKAAYHQQCTDCHRKMNQGPVDCIGCHTKKVPDHKRSGQAGGAAGTVSGHLRMPALPQGSRRRYAQPPTGSGKALRLTP
jgi:hypothetical protein